MEATASALGVVTRAGDMVCRFDSTGFLVVSAGGVPDPGLFKRRVEDQLVAGGVALGKRPVLVDVSSAGGDPSVVSFDGLFKQLHVSG